MNKKYIALIIVIAFVLFVLWSIFDTTCKPCIIPPDAPENAACTMSCKPEPRWVSWFR